MRIPHDIVSLSVVRPLRWSLKTRIGLLGSTILLRAGMLWSVTRSGFNTACGPPSAEHAQQDSSACAGLCSLRPSSAGALHNQKVMIMIQILKMEVLFSNLWLQRNFVDGLCFKLNSMKEFLTQRLHEDEEKARKLIDAGLVDSDEFTKLSMRIAENEAGRNEAAEHLAAITKYYREISDGATPPSLLPKEKKPQASRETREALIARLAAKQA